MFRSSPLGLQGGWILDPFIANGCVANASDGWKCLNGTTIVSNEILITPEASSAHVQTVLTKTGLDSPPDPTEITLYFTLREITSGTGLRLRTTGNVLEGQFTAGANTHTYTASSAPDTIQFEVIAGFGTWAVQWCSTVQAGP